MIVHVKVKKNTAKRLVVFYLSAGQPKTGLSVTVRIMRRSDGHFLQSDGSWQSAASSDPAAVEWASANFPGIYYFDFQLPDAMDDYLILFDGSATMTVNRYQHMWIEGVAGDETDLKLARAVLANSQQQDIATGIVTVMDDDGVTPLVTMTPRVDDADNPTTNILTAGGA